MTLQLITDKADEWAGIIRADLGRTVEAILATGRHLIDAKAELDHGEWLPMLERVGISHATASRFMSIAQHPTLTNFSCLRNLPPTLTTLYQLSRLPPAVLEAAIKDGTVTPELANEGALELIRRQEPHQPNRSTPRGRRRPITESFGAANYKLRRLTERLTRLTEDDRFQKNKDQIAGANLNDLIRCHDALESVIQQLKG